MTEIVSLTLRKSNGTEHTIDFDHAYFDRYREGALWTWHIEVYGSSTDAYATLSSLMHESPKVTAIFTDRFGVTRSGEVIISRLRADQDGGFESFLQGSGPVS